MPLFSFKTDTFNRAIFKKDIFINIDLINFPKVSLTMCFAKHFTFLPYTEFSSFNGNKMHFLPTDPVEIFKSHLDMVLDKQF